MFGTVVQTTNIMSGLGSGSSAVYAISLLSARLLSNGTGGAGNGNVRNGRVVITET